MTLFLHICGVLAVLAIPYAAITYADRRAQQRRRNEALFDERKAKVMGDAYRTRA